MRIQVDHARCVGHGRCESIAPDVYRLDDDAQAHLVHEETPDELRDSAEKGARACPAEAITVYE